MDAIEVIKTRRTVRAYQDKAVSRDTLKDLVECARLAPTAMNHQPWEFVVVTDMGMRKKLASLIAHAPQLAQAPACIAVFTKGQWWVEDGSAATQNIQLAAWAHGLGTCWVSANGPWSEGVREVLGVPTDWKPLSIVTVGYPAEQPKVEKRPLEGVIHWERF